MTAYSPRRDLAPVVSRAISEAAPHEADARAARPGTLLRRLAALPATVREAFRRRAVLAELSELSDRELTDIGLNRAELPRVFDPRFAQAREEAWLV